MDKLDLPKGWIYCTNYGNKIPNENIIPMRTPFMGTSHTPASIFI
jgi:hypothetical protein